MKVFAVYSEKTVELISPWAASWTARGWIPRLISPQDIEEHGSARRAVEALGGGFLSDCRVINYGFRPIKQALRPAIVRYGRPGWRTAALVRFPEDATGVTVRNGGRQF